MPVEINSTRRNNGKSDCNYSKRISTAAERQTQRGQRSRFLMSSSTKFGFRPRALDVTRKLPIRIRKCRKKSPKVKRNVALAPTGMEKEEEMESHLQQAILAQKATSAGDAVENHVIPTPKVLSVNEDDYDRIYQQRRHQKGKKLITFREYVPFFLTQGSYNADSEDEEWLSAKRNITVDDFEYIIGKLEIASQNDIIKPRNARSLLQRYDSGLIDDVYDYWLQKRQKAASKNSRCPPVLMPRVCSEMRREEKAVVNPYIAFRRRVDKVQTRKKQKTELLTYEKMLQVNLAMRRSIVLFGAVAQRERLKKAGCDLDFSIYQMQYKKRISNEEMEEFIEKVNREQSLKMTQIERKFSLMEATTSQTDDFRKQAEVLMPKTTYSDLPINGFMDGNCIQRNFELWESAALITPVHSQTAAIGDESAEVEKIVAVEQNSSADGRYQFKRKHGCYYRAPVPSSDLLKDDQAPPQTQNFYELNSFRHFSARFTHEIPRPNGTSSHRTGFIRKRIGRGGRQIIDLYFPPSDPPNNQISSNL